MTTTMKCTRCNAEKPLNGYYFCKTSQRYNPRCKACKREVSNTKRRLGLDQEYNERSTTAEGRSINLFNNARARARTKNIPFTITLEWVLEKVKAGVCEVSKLPLFLEKGQGSGGGRPFSPSLDQIEAGAGYTPENTQVVCWIYNAAKGVHGHDSVMKLAEALCKK
jgi:hypothetical protein